MDILSVNMYVETSLHNPQVGKGVGMWLIEREEENGEFETKKGFVYGESTRENELALKCLINMFFILSHSYMQTGFVDVFTGCRQFASYMIKKSFVTWKKDEWKNAKGKMAANAVLWEQAVRQMEPYTVSCIEGHHKYTDYMEYWAKKELERRKENV